MVVSPPKTYEELHENCGFTSKNWLKKNKITGKNCDFMIIPLKNDSSRSFKHQPLRDATYW